MKGWAAPPTNRNFVILPSASRTLEAQMTSVTFRNAYHRGLWFYINITTRPGAETLTLNIDGIDDISGDGFEILDSGGIGASDVIGLVYPGMIDTDSKIGMDTGLPLPERWRLRIEPSASGTWIFSVGGHLIL